MRTFVRACTRVYNTVRRENCFFFPWEGKSRKIFEFCRVAGVMSSLYNDSSTSYTPKISWLDSWQVKNICLLSKISTPAPVKWVSGVSFNGIK